MHIADVTGRRAGAGEVACGNFDREQARLHYIHSMCMEFYFIGEPVAELKAVAVMQSA